MKEYICIVCPNGCLLHFDEKSLATAGNKCPRGAEYALGEYTCPKRTVCTTVRTIFPEYPVVSVRTASAIEKKMIPKLMKIIDKTIVRSYLPINSAVIRDVLNTGVDVITTSPMVKGK